MAINATVQSTPITITIQDQSPITILVSSVGIAANGIPAGGVAGNVLVKKSDLDYDCEWTTLKL
jgi:hypothetical protein